MGRRTGRKSVMGTAPSDAAAEAAAPRLVEILDERGPIAAQALELIEATFPVRERQPSEQIAMEIAEKRLDLLTMYDFHLFAAVSEEEEVLAIASGVYLGGVNTGFVTYLAVREGYRRLRLGRRLRVALVEAFRADARTAQEPDLAAVVGEVRLESPWLRRLVREREVLPLDLAYFHPGQDPTGARTRWVLYRQPIVDHREAMPVRDVRQLLYAVWRRAYRVRWPLEREGFRRMLEELEGRTLVGMHTEFATDG
jgi:ribosomal protein S18 acetylase RimI-like enzyme